MNISLNTFMWLIWRDIRIIIKEFKSSALDAILLPIGWIIVSGYIMPALGLPENYGAFMIAGMAGGMCFNSTATDAGNLVSDLEGTKSISYELSLPLAPWLLCIKLALVYAIKAFLINILIFPVGALLLWGRIDLSNISWMKFLLLYATINLMYGFFSLTIALWVKNSSNYWRFWLRWGWLMFTFAGFQFSWAVMQATLPIIAKLALLNPLLYPHEGIRAALLGQSGYINYWICLGVSGAYTVLFAFISLKRFKSRLDTI